MMRTGREERQEERGNYGGKVGGKRKEASAVEMQGLKEGGAVGKRKKIYDKRKNHGEKRRRQNEILDNVISHMRVSCFVEPQQSLKTLKAENATKHILVPQHRKPLFHSCSMQ